MISNNTSQKTRSRAAQLIALGTLFLLSVANAAKADLEGPYVYKSSVRINTRRFLVYYPTPTAKEPQYNTNSWAPRFEFNVQGPLEGGSQISVAFAKPDGSTWFSTNLNTPECGADTFQRFTSDALDLEKKAILEVGTATMTIKLSNALNKTNKVLFTGKFEVGKFHYGNASSSVKIQNEYYVNHDWELPIGQMNFDDTANAEAPHMHLMMWFRGNTSDADMAAYLYYKGKQIASTKGGGSVKEVSNVETGATQTDQRWGRCNIAFDRVSSGLKSHESANNYDQIYFLDKNPGEYEIKLLWNGKLARTAKFTVGDDGKIVDNGLAAKNNMGLGVTLIPVSVEPGMDGKADTSKYKTQAYYGNPLVGFP